MNGCSDPGWYVPSNEYRQPRFAYARQMGEDAARGLSGPWAEAEVLLKGIWRQESGGLTWAEARNAVYASWLDGKVALLAPRRSA
jgi:hypothetical protein